MAQTEQSHRAAAFEEIMGSDDLPNFDGSGKFVTWIFDKAYRAGAAAMKEKAAQIDIKEIIANHETNYIQRPDGKWDWMCSCDARQWFHTREFAVDMTRAHWTDQIKAAIRSLEVT